MTLTMLTYWQNFDEIVVIDKTDNIKHIDNNDIVDNVDNIDDVDNNNKKWVLTFSDM